MVPKSSHQTQTRAAGAGATGATTTKKRSLKTIFLIKF